MANDHVETVSKNATKQKGLRAKLRNLQLSNLLYGYQDYTDDKVLKKLVGLKSPLNSPTETDSHHTDHSTAIPSSNTNETTTCQIHHNVEQDKQQKQHSPDRDEIGLMITMSSRIPSGCPSSSSSSVNTTEFDARKPPLPLRSQTRYEHNIITSTRLDHVIHKQESTLSEEYTEYSSSSRSQLDREPSYTHAATNHNNNSARAPAAASTHLHLRTDPELMLQRRRMVDVLPPILFHCASTGRVFSARSSSQDTQPSPILADIVSSASEEDGRYPYYIQTPRVPRETLV